MQIDPPYLFVYGSLRSDAQNPLDPRYREYLRLIGSAFYQGKLYRVGDYPAAIPSKDASDRIYGEVHELNQPHVVLPVLDQYEAFFCDSPDESEFIRDVVTVLLHSGKPVETWIYLYNRTVKGLEIISSGVFEQTRHQASKV